MKIISLNIWGGKMFEPLTEFIQTAAPSTDLFCFQEVCNEARMDLDAVVSVPGFRPNTFREFESILPDFNGFFTPTNVIKARDAEVVGGLSIFSKKGVKVDSKGDVITYKNDDEGKLPAVPSKMQYIRFSKNEKKITLCNFHGIVYPGDKLDTDARLDQSLRIIDFLAGEKGEKILTGDFNLLPQTRSIAMIESAGMRNLIKDFDIRSTRSDISYGMYLPLENRQHFADFMFTSAGIEVGNFEVPRLDISDHLPLILQFD